MDILSEFEIWMFLAGLGIFLFGMHMMEESIRVLSGAAFKSMIRRYTGTRIKAILSGMFSTAILQSSSAVSLMVLAFAGAGVMSLVQAISVMMGAKIGTTATAWIVAVFGFKVNIDAFSLPMIGIGGLGIILLAKSPKYVNISKFLVAFGFLFMGLDYMKSSVDQISEILDPAAFAGYGIIAFAFVGMVMTAVMQSSSATIAIVLTMLFSGVVSFQAGAAMVVGANVGTTVTVLLGSIGGIHTQKQAALSQLIFTTGTAIVTMAVLPLLSWFVLSGLGFTDNLVLGLAMFHTLFNVAGVVLYYPLIPGLARFAEKKIPEKVVQLSSFIHKTSPEISEAGIEAFRKEIICQLQLTLRFIGQIAGQPYGKEGIEYADLQKYHADIFEYYTRLHSYEMKEGDSKTVDSLLRVSRSIMNSAKNIYESRNEIIQLKNEPEAVHKSAYMSIRERVDAVAEAGRQFENLEKREAVRRAGEIVTTLHEEVERKDKEFIAMCTQAVQQPGFRKGETTLLLMMNRIITQSCRMLVFGMRTLLQYQESQNEEIS